MSFISPIFWHTAPRRWLTGALKRRPAINGPRQRRFHNTIYPVLYTFGNSSQNLQADPWLKALEKKALWTHSGPERGRVSHWGCTHEQGVHEYFRFPLSKRIPLFFTTESYQYFYIPEKILHKMSSKAQPGLKGNLPSSINVSYVGNRVRTVKLRPVNEKV
jgi:hypothetical protein